MSDKNTKHSKGTENNSLISDAAKDLDLKWKNHNENNSFYFLNIKNKVIQSSRSDWESNWLSWYKKLNNSIKYIE